ncbi:MAG: ABC transporter permease [Fimbriimonadaceae bacterium]
MRLAKAIAIRLFFGALSLLVISFVVFVAGEMMPGDAATIRAGEKGTPERIAILRAELGLNRPWTERYRDFVTGAVRFEFGESYYRSNRKVSEIIAESMPITIKLALYAMALAAITGILLGVFAAIYQNRFIDRAILAVSTLGVTIPNFVLAPILIYIFYFQLNRLPQDYDADLIRRGVPEYMFLILPVICLAARPMAMLTRLTRASMIDTMQQEFIRTAIAKGVSTYRLITKHALRNAIMPVVTAIGTSFGFLLTGSFVVEIFFRLPGIGYKVIDAINERDTPVLQAGVLLTGALFILINLLVDVMLPILDPRIREAQV